ncbi:MAG: hypothetical protein ACJ72E_00830 [Marmoricola sp.]
MTQPPESPQPSAPQPVAPPPVPPTGSSPLMLTVDLSRLPSVATALGVSFLSAAIVMSATYSRRQDNHLDASNFTMGVLATLALLGIAAAAQVIIADPVRKEMLVSWPGAFGASGVGFMLATLITKDKVAEHVAPLAALAIAILGYLLIRSTPFVLVALASSALLYARIFDDLFNLNTGGDSGNNVFMLIGAGVLVFVVAATAIGWLLPATRIVTGVVTGIGGLAGMVVLLIAVTAFRSLTIAFSSGFASSGSGFSSSDGSSSDFGSSSDVPFSQFTKNPIHDPYKNDVYMILLYCAALAAIWVVASLQTGHVGFRLLVLATAIIIVPLASFAVITEHPTWWEVVSAAVGGLILGALGLGAVRGGASAAPPAYAPPPAAG